MEQRLSVIYPTHLCTSPDFLAFKASVLERVLLPANQRDRVLEVDMAAEGLADRVPNQRLDLRVVRGDDVPLDGEVLVLVGPHGATCHMTRVDDSALGRVRLVLAGAVPDAADNEDGVALAHLARGTQRAVRRPTDCRLGPPV